MGIHSDRLGDREQRSAFKPLSELNSSIRESDSRRIRRGDNRSRTTTKFLRLIKSLSTRGIYNSRTWRKFSIHPELFWARPDQSNNNSKNNSNTKRNRYRKHLYAIATIGSLLSPNVALAQGVGGVSATANPIANSSGSVTNQAIQVLQGPYITNTYGNGVSCQGSTFNLTPYVQFADSRKDPWEDFYLDPQYDMTDVSGKMSEVTTTVKNYPWYNGWKHDNAGNLVYDESGNKIPTDNNWYNTSVRTDPNDPKYDVNEDGIPDRYWNDGDSMEITIDQDGPDGRPDNPGDVVWEKKVRTDMKANQNFNLGLSATLSLPLNRKLQRQCIEAAQAQIDMNTQLVANKRLDFELARLKNCGELQQKGIRFHPKSTYAAICHDVVVDFNPNSLIDHTHKLGSTKTETNKKDTTSSKTDAKQGSLDSDLSDQASVPPQKGLSQIFQGLSLPWQKPSSQEALSPSEGDLLGVWQVGQMKSPQQQSSQ